MAEEKNIELKYKELQKKLQLPEFNQLNNVFEINSLQNDHFLLRNIRRTIAAKLEHITKIVEELLQPDTHFRTLTESSSISEKQKQQLLKFYKQIMHLLRLSDELDYSYNDKKDAEYISNLFLEWEQINVLIKSLLEQLKLSWQKEEIFDHDIGYLG